MPYFPLDCGHTGIATWKVIHITVGPAAEETRAFRNEVAEIVELGLLDGRLTA